jgi:hypothetical protein
MPHRQDILGGVNGELAAIIDLVKYKIGSVVYLIGADRDRPLTVIGSIKRNDGERCCMVCWHLDGGALAEAAIPEHCLEQFGDS